MSSLEKVDRTLLDSAPLQELSFENLPTPALHSIFLKVNNVNDRIALKLLNHHIYKIFNSTELQISVLKKTATALVKAINRRGLSASPLEGEQKRLKKDYKKKFDMFFDEFVVLNNITSVFLTENLEFALNLLKFKMKEKGFFTEINRIQLKTTRKDFFECVFYGLINYFANQPLKEITPENYEEKRDQIHSIFNRNSPQFIEKCLCDAICEKHLRLAEIAHELNQVDPETPHFIAVKAALKADLEAKKKAVDARLKNLNRNGGLIQTAEIQTRAAQWNFSIKDSLFQQLCFHPESLDDLETVLESNPTDAFINAARNLRIKEKILDTFFAELNILVKIDETGCLVGGKSYELSTQLENLDQITAERCQQLSQFYKMLQENSEQELV